MYMRRKSNTAATATATVNAQQQHTNDNNNKSSNINRNNNMNNKMETFESDNTTPTSSPTGKQRRFFKKNVSAPSTPTHRVLPAEDKISHHNINNNNNNNNSNNSHPEKSPGGQQRTPTRLMKMMRREKAGALEELHADLQNLADRSTPGTSKNNGHGSASSAMTASAPMLMEGSNGDNVKRLLQGKKLVRVKRVSSRGVSTATLESTDSMTTPFTTKTMTTAATTTTTNTTSSTSTSTPTADNHDTSRKVLRVKVKRKKKEDSGTSTTTTKTVHSPYPSSSNRSVDVDSMAPVKRGMGRSRSGRRRNKSDASVGTGVLSKARSWFTFGGLKLGSSGRDFLNDADMDDDMEDDDMEDDMEDRLTQAQDYDEYDEEDATMDVRTSTPDEATATIKDDYTETPAPVAFPTCASVATSPEKQVGAKPTSVPTTTTSILKTALKQSSFSNLRSSSSSLAATAAAAAAAAASPAPTAPVSPRPPAATTTTQSRQSVPRSPEKSIRTTTSVPRRRNNNIRTQHPLPTQDIVVQPGVPRRQPLTGVALRRLQIQEKWLSVGCNFKPNPVLASVTNAASTATTGQSEDDYQDDMSEISYEEPIGLVMGPDAPSGDADREIQFWTNVVADCNKVYGRQHSKTGEAWVNKGVAELNARQTASAIESLIEANQIFQEKYGEEHLSVARAMHLLGSAFFLDGQLPVAVEATHKALDLRKKLLGEFHTDTVDTFSNLAMVYLKMSKLLEAARIFHEVLTIRKVIYDEYHPSVAFPARSLACVYAKRRDNARARENYTYALKAFEKHGMLMEHMNTEAEMRRFGMHPPVDDTDDGGRLEI